MKSRRLSVVGGHNGVWGNDNVAGCRLFSESGNHLHGVLFVLFCRFAAPEMF